MTRRWLLLGAIGGAARGAAGGVGSIAYLHADGLWICEPPAQPRWLVSGEGLSTPRFSASGKWISYLAGGSLRVIAAAGGMSRHVGKAGRWMPVGDEMLVESTNGLQVASAADGWRTSREFKGAALPVVFSPRGDAMVYGVARQRTGQLWHAALDGRTAPKLLVSKRDAMLIPAGYGADTVLYWDDPDFSQSVLADGLELWQVPVPGGTARTIGVKTLVHDEELSWTAARDKLALSAGSGRNQWEEKRIATIDVKTGAVEYVTGRSMSAVDPAWSPNDAEIVYSAAPSASAGGGEQARRALAQRRIWRGSRQLTNDAGYRDEAPAWSSDGAYIVFGRMSADNARYLWLMRADGSDAREIAGPLSGEGSWFGYYGWLDWHSAFDWWKS